MSSSVFWQDWWRNEGLMHVVVTLNYIMGQVISFCVPLIIIGFIAPSITKLGKNASRMLGIALVLAYTSSLGAALFLNGGRLCADSRHVYQSGRGRPERIAGSCIPALHSACYGSYERPGILSNDWPGRHMDEGSYRYEAAG